MWIIEAFYGLRSVGFIDDPEEDIHVSLLDEDQVCRWDYEDGLFHCRNLNADARKENVPWMFRLKKVKQ